MTKPTCKKITSIKDMCEQAINECPDRIAYKYKQKSDVVSVTYKEFYDETMSLGAAINKLECDGKRIACIGDNSYNWIVVQFTVLKSNAVFVPIDKELPTKDIINILNHSEANMLFYAERYEKQISEIMANCPKLDKCVAFARDEDVNEKILSFKKLKEEGKKIVEAGEFKEPDHENLKIMKEIIYTSGTTGTPKGVMLTEFNLISSVMGALNTTTLEDTCMSVLPYHHTYEATCNILTGFHNRTTLCINDSLKNVANNLNLYKPKDIYIVPAFAEMFYKKIWSSIDKQGKTKLVKRLIKISNGLRKIHIDLRKPLFQSIRDGLGGNLVQIVCGGAPLRAEIGEFFIDIGICFQNGYGITECSPLVSVNTPWLNDPRTVGTHLACCEVKIDNPNEEGIGEICVKGDIVMLGYYKNEEKTKEVLKDGWFGTGDYGYLNSKGQIVIKGRMKNFFVLENGKNIYPEEIEDFVLAVPYVKEAVVKATQNEYGMNGNNLCAEVFLDAEAVKAFDDVDIAKKLKDDINEKMKELPVYKHIAEVKIRDTEFAKTTTNKIKR